MPVDPGIFRAYDIRGKVGRGIDVEAALAIGKAFGTYVARENGKTEIAVGRDNRASGEDLQRALIDGLISTGATVYNIGMSTSPALYYAVGHWGLPGGINVTGSHNPPDENGFKLVGEGNWPIAGDEVQEIRKLIERREFRTGQGRVVEREVKREYFAHLKEITQLERRFRVAVDTGNGVAGLFAPPLLREIGCDVVELHTELDNTYPNHLPDPQMPENVVCLQEKVRATGVDIGLAFDGDGDRLGVIDEKGARLEPDYIMIPLSRALLEGQPKEKVVVDIKSSQPVVDDISEHGGEPIVWKTGHSNIKIKMREIRAPLGGEASGHIFYAENFYADDALFAACKLLSYLSRSDKPVSAHYAGVPKWFTSPELRVPCPDDKKWAIVDAVAADLRAKHPSVEIDGIRATWPNGWALIRASNTGPNLTLRFESKTERGLAEIDAEVMASLRAHLPDAQVSSGH